MKRKTARVLELVAKQKAALDAGQPAAAAGGAAEEQLRADLRAARARVTELQRMRVCVCVVVANVS